MKKILLVLGSLAFFIAEAQMPDIIPKPNSCIIGKGYFSINEQTKIVLWGTGLEKPALFLQDYLSKMYYIQLPIVKHNSGKGNIVLNYHKIEATIPGAHEIEITGSSVTISGDNAAGVFYGIQSLLQLLPHSKNQALDIPQLSLSDQPRFAYRGMHLDVGRHFFSVDFIKKYIDFIALHKLNIFHWHLTEDQGWRIEIKKYPNLTAIGAFRNGTITGKYPGESNTNTRYGGFYTQNQIKEIVQYASDRFVEIIPEIELPGHASAAIAAYPELSCFPKESTQYPDKTPWNGSKEGKQVQQTWGIFEDVLVPSEYTFNFLENVFNEVIQLFPSKYIHIGGDECPKASWKRSDFCQQLIKEKGLKDEHGLQSYFIQRIEKYLNSKGKQIIGWDEILEGGLAPNATVMSWRGEKGGIEAAKQNHAVIMTPGEWMYFDHKQTKNEDSITIGGFTPIQKVYSYEPIPNGLSAEEEKKILGAQANMWTEYMTNTAKVEYMLFPRISALSEVLWSKKENKNWGDFEKRLQNQFKRYNWLGIHFSKAYFDPINQITLSK